jgi:DNA-directed RNA polymerase specialized sigma24 family protein
LDLEELLDSPETSGLSVRYRLRRESTFEYSGRAFKAYLAQAIHNHFANFCRTKFRKEKEELLSPGLLSAGVLSSANSAGAQVVSRVSSKVQIDTELSSLLLANTFSEEELVEAIDFSTEIKKMCGPDAKTVDALNALKLRWRKRLKSKE